MPAPSNGPRMGGACAAVRASSGITHCGLSSASCAGVICRAVALPLALGGGRRAGGRRLAGRAFRRGGAGQLNRAGGRSFGLALVGGALCRRGGGQTYIAARVPAGRLVGGRAVLCILLVTGLLRCRLCRLRGDLVSSWRYTCPMKVSVSATAPSLLVSRCGYGRPPKMGLCGRFV